jgi:hypothetical protein
MLSFRIKISRSGQILAMGRRLCDGCVILPSVSFENPELLIRSSAAGNFNASGHFLIASAKVRSRKSTV